MKYVYIFLVVIFFGCGGSDDSVAVMPPVAANDTVSTLENTSISISVLSNDSLKNNAKLGKGDWAILEADESDGSFLKLPINYSIVTNDVVKIIGNSEFELLGRFDNVINSAGVKLFPEQIEMKLAHKISTRFFVIGIPDDQYGEQLALVIEGDSISFDDDFFNDLLPYEKPKLIYFVPDFLETESGKIKRMETLNLV